MNVAASPIWLAYAFGFGVALALVDRALKAHWLAALFGCGGLAAAVFSAWQSHASENAQPLLTALTIFAVLAAGYLIVEALFVIGGLVGK